jgi:glycosyltransferase involved in cell wall biosynthesis
MRIDLHVHSKYSQRPTAWFLQKIGCPESFTEPLHLYQLARKRGMTAVTITDHNRIDGALEIAHLPDTFISEEVTAYFPEDGCKVHVLALNITEAHHEEIQKVRENVFDLVDYLRGQSIVHVLAHPLYRVNDRLSVDHLEKALLLFRNFELNGSRNSDPNVCLENLVGSLTPGLIDRLADKHGIAPAFEDPWRKNLTGGSDDHSSLNIARTFTEIPDAESVGAFLVGIEAHRAKVVQQPSTPGTLAHNLYGIAYQYYRNRFDLRRYVNKDPLMTFLDRTLTTESESGDRGLMARIVYFWKHRRRSRAREEVADGLMGLLRQETYRLLNDTPGLIRMATVEQPDGTDEARWFDFVNQAANRVLAHTAGRVLDQVSGANVFNLFQNIGSAGGLYTLLAPYFIAYSLFSQDRHFARSVRARFNLDDDLTQGLDTPPNVAHFTDTFHEINGVALTLRQQLKVALGNGKQMTIVTCDHERRPDEAGIRNFSPIGVYDLPEYPEQKLFFPPLLEMLRFCYRRKITHIHSATPGPVGLAALAIAHILKLPIVGTYHTQLPQYARFLTGDHMVQDLTWKYTLWYYDQMETVYAPSEATRRELVEKGLAPGKVRCYPRGIDIDRFRPDRSDSRLASRFGLGDGVKLLYVGRVSREKNLHLLAEAYRRICRRRSDVQLAIVGDGPYLEALQNELAGTPAVFTGYLTGDDLAGLFASCDVFVFPSATDTFGNVILEAQASGLPVIVSDRGGPKENMLPDQTGRVVPADNVAELEAALLGVVDAPQERQRMGRAARRYMQARSFDEAFLQTWRMYETAPDDDGDANHPELPLAG